MPWARREREGGSDRSARATRETTRPTREAAGEGRRSPEEHSSAREESTKRQARARRRERDSLLQPEGSVDRVARLRVSRSVPPPRGRTTAILGATNRT